MEKVRGSSPLLPTKVRKAHAVACVFYLTLVGNNARISEQQSEIKGIHDDSRVFFERLGNIEHSEDIAHRSTYRRPVW